jgi:hypothetical protein
MNDVIEIEITHKLLREITLLERSMGYVLHKAPGRLRIRIPDLKTDAVRAERVRKFLEAVPGVESATVRDTTGSVIINFHPRSLSHRRLLSILAEQGYIDSSKPIFEHQPGKEIYDFSANAASKAILGAAFGRLTAGTPFAVLSVLI